MKKLKSSLQNMTLVMTIVAAITGGLLAFVNHATEPSIKKQLEKPFPTALSVLWQTKRLLLPKPIPPP